MISGAVRTIYAGRRPAYPGAGLTRVRYLVLSSVRDTATKKMISGAVRTIYAMRAGGPRTQVRVPGCRLDEGSLPCLVVRSRYGDEKDDFRRGTYHLCYAGRRPAYPGPRTQVQA